jgi:predicted enzyme related to lactoylglutathione lyase
MTNENKSNTVNYIEIPCDETKVLRDFYSSLLGWKFEEGKDTPDYLFTSDSGVKGAILNRSLLMTVLMRPKSWAQMWWWVRRRYLKDITHC